VDRSLTIDSGEDGRGGSSRGAWSTRTHPSAEGGVYGGSGSVGEDEREDEREGCGARAR
jgi:hypothetical protein